MSQLTTFQRKIVYCCAIVLLLFPLFWIGQPSIRVGPDEIRPGGVLATLRDEYSLSQAQLGEIDPASESMKLATLGLRGVAANILWEKANEYKKKEDWDNLSATLNQITKLQPNFITVWEHQAHNLSYNISAEFDDYRYRYHWVKKGITFLMEGVDSNSENPRLLHYTGWITGQKIGRADEHVQFRELYREDDDFHDLLSEEIPLDDAYGINSRPDNWLTSRLWYLRAERSDVPLKGKSPLIFYADAPMSLINYGATIEDEGFFGDTARQAWKNAGEAWDRYGQRPLPTSWGHTVRLGEYEIINEEIEAMREALEELAPGVRDQIYEEKVAELTDAQRAALDLSQEELTEENYQDYWASVERTRVTHEDVVERAPAENRDKARRLAARLMDKELMSQRTAHYRGIINYEYWDIRCTAEQTATALDAREYVYKARKAQEEAALEEARENYELAWVQWRKIFDDYPRLTDDVSAEDLMESIQRYERLLQQLDEDIPADFPLVDFVGMRAEREEAIDELYKKLQQDEDSPDSDSGDEADEMDETPEASDDAPPGADAAAEPTTAADDDADDDAGEAADEPKDADDEPAAAAEETEAAEPGPSPPETEATEAGENEQPKLEPPPIEEGVDEAS